MPRKNAFTFTPDKSFLFMFSDRITAFNQSLHFPYKLPENIQVMNPFKESEIATSVSEQFYKKYYGDDHLRRFILGINPGRFGGGMTGIPFTDPKRLTTACGIPYNGDTAHEPSSVFIYEMIEAFGGVENFYRIYYINSVCPLGFTSSSKKNAGVLNYNYYDSKELEQAARPFIVDTLHKQIQLGIDRTKAFCLGTGKNYAYLLKLNETYKFFGTIIPLEHPRYIMQYKSRQKADYIRKYIDTLKD